MTLDHVDGRHGRGKRREERGLGSTEQTTTHYPGQQHSQHPDEAVKVRPMTTAPGAPMYPTPMFRRTGGGMSAMVVNSPLAFPTA